MFERWRKNLAESNYGPLGLEIIVVILGILIAFQIDRWAEDRRDREQEYDYLVRLKEDLQIEIQSMDQAIQYAKSRIAAVLLLEEVIANPSIVTRQPKAVPVAIETATWRSFPQINAFVYTELQSTGNLALIRSESLRRDLAKNGYTCAFSSIPIPDYLNVQVAARIGKIGIYLDRVIGPLPSLIVVDVDVVPVQVVGPRHRPLHDLVDECSMLGGFGKHLRSQDRNAFPLGKKRAAQPEYDQSEQDPADCLHAESTMLTRWMHTASTSTAVRICSNEGRLGAKRMLESWGSLP